MPLTTLSCPHCGFSREIDDQRLPPRGTKVTCPRCKGFFFLGVEAAASTPGPAGPAAIDAATEPPSPPPLPPDRGIPHVSPAPETPRHRTLAFTFTGSGKEYFGIWAVNTLLRIITLGIYSPWAKVRKRRYFYTNTLLDDAPFDYLADPVAILKGWIIAGCFFGLYSLASRTSPALATALMLAFFGVFPWVVVRSRIFNLRNATHRNIRFNFSANNREAYKVFLAWQLAVPFTLGILAPYVIYRQKRFLVENSFYGTTPFRFHATARQFYRIFVPVLIGLLVCIGLFAATIFLSRKGGGLTPAFSVISTLSFVGIYFFAAVYIPTVMTNLTWNATGIGAHRFESTLRVRDLAWIYVSNVIAIVCTVGLLAPWAAVRLARYRLGRLTLSGTGELAASAGEGGMVNAAAEELGDMLGFDLGL